MSKIFALLKLLPKVDGLQLIINYTDLFFMLVNIIFKDQFLNKGNN